MRSSPAASEPPTSTRDVDQDAASIRIQSSLQRDGRGYVFVEPKTARSRRQIVLGDATVTVLRRWRIRQAEERFAIGAAWEDNGLVFTNAIGQNALGVLRTSFPALIVRADVPRIRFHDLRHSAATLLLGQGVHPKIVSEMLGHSTIAITLDLYSHVTPTMQRDAAAVLDAVLRR
jgi:integrase